MPPCTAPLLIAGLCLACACSFDGSTKLGATEIDNTDAAGDTDALGLNWWNQSWGKRQRIRVDNIGGTTHQDAILPVFLQGSRSEVGTISPAGDDMRFISAAGEELPYDLDDYNSGGVAWVRFPEIAANSDQSYIFLYYDNPTATAFGDEDTWTEEYLGVWHLGDDILDASGNGNHPTVGGGTATAGTVAGGRTFNPGNADALLIPTSSSLDALKHMTFSTWLNRRVDQGSNTCIFGRQFQSGAEDHFWFGFSNNQLGNLVRTTGDGVVYSMLDSVTPNNEWIFYTAVFDGSDLAYYINGEIAGSAPATGELLVGTETFSLGGQLNGGDMNTSDRLDGQFDEAQLQNTPRSSDWVKLQYDAQRDQLLIYDTPESR